MNNIEQMKIELYAHRLMGYITWGEVADILNKETNEYFSPDKYRKEYDKYYKELVDNYVNTEMSAPYVTVSNSSECEFDCEDQLREIRKEKFKLSDERTQNNAILRRLAREDTIKEIALDFAKEMNKEKVLTPTKSNKSYLSEYEGTLVLSDWHYGLCIDSYFNKYNPEICKARVQKLQDEVIRKCEGLKISKLNVVNLSDLIAGRIHQTIRLQSRIDTITQIMEVSELLAEFLYNLSQHVDINYFDCLDNHGRVEPNRSESLDLESLTRITKWYLKERFFGFDSIKIFDNRISEDIITFMSKGHKIIAVHGHKDKSSKVIDNLSMFTQDHYDLVLSAHEHHFSADEKNNTIRLSSGTLMGSDQFSESLRLTSTPSQLLVISSSDNVVEYISRIVVE